MLDQLRSAQISSGGQKFGQKSWPDWCGRGGWGAARRRPVECEPHRSRRNLFSIGRISVPRSSIRGPRSPWLRRLIWYPVLIVLGYLVLSFIAGTLWFGFGGPEL